MTANPASVSFTDTNILVYALAANDPRRSKPAQDLLRELMAAQTLRTSTQVLQELFVTLTRKIAAPMTAEQVLRYMDRIAAWPVVLLDYAAIRSSVELTSRYSLSFWDALVVVAAARSGAATLYTEDLQHGQTILGVRIVNPFL